MKVSGVVDDFRSGLAAGWTVVSGSPEVSSHRLVLPTDPGNPVELRWSEPVDLTNSQIYVKVRPDVGDLTRFRLELAADTDNRVSTHVISTNPSALRFRMRQGGITSDTWTDHNPDTHGWWRIREAGGRVFWDTSSNGSAWVNQRVEAHTMALSAVTLTIATDAVVVEAGYGGGMYGIGSYGD